MWKRPKAIWQNTKIFCWARREHRNLKRPKSPLLPQRRIVSPRSLKNGNLYPVCVSHFAPLFFSDGKNSLARSLSASWFPLSLTTVFP
jgi:hypothetical protein